MPLWLTDLAILIALLLVSELMFRAGRARGVPASEHVHAQVTGAQASSLGLLALMLAFTLSMAESRFNARRGILIAEANAIGTTYLRAAYLPEPMRSQSRQQLRDYVKARRAYYRASLAEEPAATARGQELQRRLWDQVVTFAPSHLDSDVVALYIESLNQVIDLEASRDLAIGARMPWTINFLLVIIALVAVGITGYATGLGGGRVSVTLYVTPALVALACTIVADLDRSRAGYISTGDRPMVRLEASMDAQNRMEAASDAVMPR